MSNGKSANSLLFGGLLVITAACTPAPPRLDTISLPPGAPIPNQPDLVTVVPFQFAAPFQSWSQVVAGYILIPAEVDGRRGTFLLDTGAGNLLLNGAYVQPSRTEGIDTVRDSMPQSEDTPGRNACRTPKMPAYPSSCFVAIHTLRLGTLRQSLTLLDSQPGVPHPPTNASIDFDARFQQFGRPVLGWLGPNALASFETIIDYPHQRVIFIKLDAAGRRRVPVPTFTPVAAVPLVPLPANIMFWGVEAKMGAFVDTLLIDTGYPYNAWRLGYRLNRTTSHVVLNPPNDDSLNANAPTFEEIEGVMPFSAPGLRVQHLSIGRQTFDDVYFADDPIARSVHHEVMGYPLLRKIGVVGFNFRTYQLLMY